MRTQDSQNVCASVCEWVCASECVRVCARGREGERKKECVMWMCVLRNYLKKMKETKINSKLSQETILNFYAQTNDLFSVFLFNYELEYFFNVRFVLVCHIHRYVFSQLWFPKQNVNSVYVSAGSLISTCWFCVVILNKETWEKCD